MKRLTLLTLLTLFTAFLSLPASAQFDKDYTYHNINSLASPLFQGRRTGTPHAQNSAYYILQMLKEVPNIDFSPGEAQQFLALDIMGVKDLNGLEYVHLEAGTQEYYVGKDVEGKVVRISSDAAQGKEFDVRINSNQAFLHGAKAIIQDIPVNNIFGMLKAPKERNPDGDVVVIGAHYDHMGINVTTEGDTMLYAGADDNASGVAMMLHFAHSLSRVQEQLRKDVIFVAFDGEEMGLVGSKHFVQNIPDYIDKIKFMINFDMLGRMDRNKTLYIRGVGSFEEGVAFLNGVPNCDNLNFVWEFWGNGPTDYASFYNAGIPTLSFSTGRHSDFHKVTDTIDKINFEGMEMAEKYIGNVIKSIVMSPVTYVYKAKK